MCLCQCHRGTVAWDMDSPDKDHCYSRGHFLTEVKVLCKNDSPIYYLLTHLDVIDTIGTNLLLINIWSSHLQHDYIPSSMEKRNVSSRSVSEWWIGESFLHSTLTSWENDFPWISMIPYWGSRYLMCSPYLMQQHYQFGSWKFIVPPMELTGA